MSIIIKSNSLPHLHAAKGAGRWAFAVRANDKADLALLTFLQNRLHRNSGIIGFYTGGDNDKDNAGALLYGFLQMDNKAIQAGSTENIWWPGEYHIILSIDWHYIRKDQKVVDKVTISEILGDLRSGHHPKEVFPDEFFKIITS